MTDLEYRALYFAHMRRDLELTTDQLLQRAVIAGHARKRGHSFIYLYADGGSFL